ncbi:uncharacterized protein [Solanum tuberosum]|uniref:uncharacterized protein n=1 Tax=Solanum tuberosum TaxID=4113 RepID=UPI000739FE0A|nr:PREDICTED: uncharacterized protein LOC107058781 [Solanum tuberosum]
MVWRIMSNNWYSIIVNGKRYGFFQSTRGLKQGDPLSPALFILGEEVLSRSLNRLHNNPEYHGFFMEVRGPQVNHLSFADDIILFTSGRQKTLKLIMQTLNSYEETSGQLINRDKSHFMVHSCAFNSTRDRIKKITGFKQKEGPITYLGCPLFVGRPRIIYFADLINKVLCRITGWQTKLLSYGGRAILVKHVLQSLPIHLLSAVTPPVAVLKQIQSIMADFFWGWKDERKKYHWASWKNLSFPYDEGGVGMRNLKDAPNSQLANILSTELYIQQDLPDQAIWKPNTNGKFSCSSAWNEIREKRTKTKPGLDTIEHIFNNGHFATYVWKSFAGTAGINNDHSSLPQLITQWWSAKYNNKAHKLLLQATPIFICWNLWNNRCASKYGGKLSNVSRVKYAIYKDNYKLMTTIFSQIKWPSNWQELFQLGEKCIHETKVTLVQWIKPPDQWVKINTDGSALNNPGRIGAGGIIRDQTGELLLAFAAPLGEGTNNQAEIGATIFGMT